ncbi:aspartyl protease family protein 2-like [Triticum dicoccoides]|uniref:aspartyl protease family protein 2-like n=1 Tax=Triticum dicoccoides TaxID=85692 RepID=UPI00189052D4|nr:aspartyl protease family protein 2-like [Triticum dicoccoides]
MAFSVVVGLGSGTGRHDYNLKLNALGSLMWLQCKPCNAKQPQCAPMFEPKASSTFQQVAGTSQICHLPYPMEPAGSSAPYTYPYYVSLMGISLDANRLTGIRQEMFAWRRGGQGGCMVDPGTPLTVLVREAYHVVEEPMWGDLQRNRTERMQRQGYGLCVRKTTEIKWHLWYLSFHFTEEKARPVVMPEQLFTMVEGKLHGATLCLAMSPGEWTVIGALQQVDTRFVYDLKDAKLSFVSEPCSQDTAGVD